MKVKAAAAHGGELNSHVVYLIKNNCDECFTSLSSSSRWMNNEISSKMLHFMMSYEPQKNCRQVKNRFKRVLCIVILHMYIYLWLSRPNTESFLANFFDFLSATRPDTFRVFLDFQSDCCCCENFAPLTHFEAGPSVRQTPPGTIRHVSAEGVLSAENKPLRCRLMYMYEFTFRKSQFVRTPSPLCRL